MLHRQDGLLPADPAPYHRWRRVRRRPFFAPRCSGSMRPMSSAHGDPRMATTTPTRGRVLTGISARYYDFGNALFGVPLVIRKHVSLIRMKDGDSLLDVGCGTGAVLRRVQRAFGERISLLGIDPSPDILRVAARKLRGCPNARVAPGIGEGLSFPDNSFD